MTKVCENLKSTIWRCRVAFSIEGMGDLFAVLRFIAAGSILVLEWSFSMLYTLVHISEIVTPKSFKAVKHFPAWTVTIEQSKTSPVVTWCVGDCPTHLFESASLLEEGSSSLKDQNCHLILGKSLTVIHEW